MITKRPGTSVRSQRIVADDGEQVAQGEEQKQIEEGIKFLFANYAEFGFESAQDQSQALQTEVSRIGRRTVGHLSHGGLLFVHMWIFDGRLLWLAFLARTVRLVVWQGVYHKIITVK